MVNRKKGILFLLLMVLAAFWIGCESTTSDQKTYDEKQIKLNDADRDAMAAYVRKCLADTSAKPEGFSAALTGDYNKDVFVDIFAAGIEPLQTRAREGSVAESLRRACQQLHENPAFPTRFGAKLDQARLAIHIVDKVKTLPSRDLKKISRLVEPGIHGLIVDGANGRRGFQVAEEVLYQGWGMKGFGDKDRVMGKAMSELQLKKLCKNAKLGENDWKDEKKTKLYFFTSHDFVEDKPGGGKTLETYRAHKLYPKEITRSQLLEAAWMAARNLAYNTKDDGMMGYHQRPEVDRFAKGYNIVRHAGAVWGLFTAYKATGDVELLNAGLRALKYLIPNIKIAAEDPNVAYLDYQGQSILGTNALTAMALVDIPPELLTPEWKTLREKLGNGVIAFQVADGQFYASWSQKLKGGPVPSPQPRYYPGEAFLSLVSLYETDPQPKWLAAAKKCAEAQMREWDKDPKQQPDAWVVQAMSKLYRIEKNEKYPQYVFKMVNWHFGHQWGMPEKHEGKLPFKDYFGGADNSTPPRSTPTSARTEANIEAWHLAKLVGNQEMAQKLGDAVMASYWQNLVDQFMPETVYYLPAPEKAVGGIRGALISNDIRIDYDQHFLSSAINGLDLAEERYGVGEFSPLSKGKILDVHKLGINPAEAAKQLGGAAPAAPAPAAAPAPVPEAPKAKKKTK